jgi:hypothetical protein
VRFSAILARSIAKVKRREGMEERKRRGKEK